MFEEYLEDAHFFALKASKLKEAREAKRYCRASVFYATSAIEAFINYIGDLMIAGGSLAPYEVALLSDKMFIFDNGRFKLVDRFELHRIEEKLKFTIYRLDPEFDFEHSPAWSQYLEFKDFRNIIVHPAHEEDAIDVDEYIKKIKMGLSAIIWLIDYLCQKIIGKPLRKKIKELSI